MDPTSPTNFHGLTFCCAYSCAKLHLYLTLLVGYHTTLSSSINFPLSQPIPKTLKTKKERQETTKKETMKPITTPQPMWHGHAQDAKKTTIKHKKAPKDQNHKTGNKHHDSIPMVPKECST